MVRLVLLFAILGSASAVRAGKPVDANIVDDAAPKTLAELKEQEYHLVDKLFTTARDLVLAEVSKSRTTVTAAKTAVSKAAPAGAPGAPGAPPFGMPKKAYLGIKPDMKAAVEPLFALSCAQTLEEMVIKRQNALSRIGMSNESIGIDMATHFQVQCPGAIPMPEDKCDEHSVALAKFIDQGKPIFIPPPAGPAGAPGAPGAAPGAAPAFLEVSVRAPSTGLTAAAPAGAPGAPGAPGAGGINSGNDWCKAFFGEFFDAIVAQVAAAGPAGAPGGAPAM